MPSPNTSAAAQDAWPALPYDAWKDTYATLHMWTQVAGKVALACGPRLNHSWGSALQCCSRGLRTLPLTHGQRSFTLSFDFVDHRLAIEASDGDARSLDLAPRTVADFYREVMAALYAMRLPVRVWPVPVEVPSPIPFEEDDVHRSYDRAYVERWWKIVSQVHRVFTERRCEFIGKCSPAHFFWGAFDLAVTRFSGRPAPPREGPAFQREAYSHEVISHGFWPGGDPVLEPAFYAYAVPEPPDLAAASIRPAGAHYHAELREFILPYEVVRTSASPEAAIAEFIDTTYDRAATLAGWDRPALERAPS
jgi:hypothetical protein